MATFTLRQPATLRALRSLPLYALGALAALSCRAPRGSGCSARRRARARVRCRCCAARPAHQPACGSSGSRPPPAELAGARRSVSTRSPSCSPRGLWLTLRARVLVVTHGVGDVNRYGVRGGFVVQLWHGIPLKRLHLDSAVALRVRRIAGGDRPAADAHAATAAAGRQHPAVPGLVRTHRRAASSQRVRHPAATAIAVTGDPRDDVCSTVEPSSAARGARAGRAASASCRADGRPVRADLARRRGRPGRPTAATWRGSIGVARRARRGAARAHAPARPTAITRPGRSVAAGAAARAATPASTSTPCCPAVDALITDYSSIAFDYALSAAPSSSSPPTCRVHATRAGSTSRTRTFSGGRDVPPGRTRWTCSRTRCATTSAAARPHPRGCARSTSSGLDGGAATTCSPRSGARTGA